MTSEKEFVQITVRAGTFDLYQADGWERVFEDDKLLTMRRSIRGCK